jgi:plastocyanin
MKKINILIIILLLSVSAYATTHIVTSSGNTFSPTNIIIIAGDVVTFNIAANHNVVEVSQATWNANGNTPLGGGFSLPFGGGSLTFNTPGMYYYVCSPHASMGMKGTIRVDGSSAINEISGIDKNTLKVYPSPFINILNVDFSLTESIATIIQVLDITGKTVYTENINSNIGENKISIDLSALTPGFYFMVLNRGKESYAERIIKM